MPSFRSVPVVDISGWRRLDAERSAVAREVDRACREVGFMYVSGHGIAPRTRAAAFAAARAFFALPPAHKVAVDARAAGSYWGYYGDRSESSDPGAHADRKEAFDLHRVIDGERLAAASEEVRRRLAGPNLWPTAVAGFRPAVEAYLAQAGALASTMFEIIAEAQGLARDHFATLIDDPIVSMRLLHYPPQPPDSDDVGIGAHHDYEALTILAQDEVGGLEVRNQAGDWVAAPPIEDTFVVNIGEMLARWTDDAYPATDHRVINRTGRERYSIPVFFATNHDTVISSWNADGGRYEPIAAGRYLVERIDSIYGSPAPSGPS